MGGLVDLRLGRLPGDFMIPPSVLMVMLVPSWELLALDWIERSNNYREDR